MSSASCFAGTGARVLARPAAFVLLLLALLAILPYVRALDLPLISDDYDQIYRGRLYGPVSGWAALLHDPLYRCRATSILFSHWTEMTLGIGHLVLNCSSLLLHILNTWLVFALGAWRVVGWKASAVAAGFFALYHGHQEAVTWYAAIPELFVFFFSVAAFLLWILWTQRNGPAPHYYWGALACFVLALFSKESAVAVVPLLAVPLVLARGCTRRRLAAILPFVALALLYTYAIFASSAIHQHFHDGTFSLRAPFVRVLWRSSSRLFYLWGLLSLLGLVVLKRVGEWRSVLLAGIGWIVITFLPYCFLTYMPFVPSRHTYFASAGLSLVVAAGYCAVSAEVGHKRWWFPVAVAIIIVSHNCVYLWTKKHQQMMERAEPTEAIVELARHVHEPVYVHCFPYPLQAAILAVQIRAHKSPEDIIWDPEMKQVKAGAPFFCWEDRNVTTHYRPEPIPGEKLPENLVRPTERKPGG